MKNFKAEITLIENINEMANYYVCMLLNKNIKRIKRELKKLKEGKLKNLIISKFNEKAQLINVTIYNMHPNLEISIGSFYDIKI